MDTDFASTRRRASDTDALQFKNCASVTADKSSLVQARRSGDRAHISSPSHATRLADAARALRASRRHKSHTPPHHTESQIQVGSISTQQRSDREKTEFHIASFRR